MTQTLSTMGIDAEHDAGTRHVARLRREAVLQTLDAVAATRRYERSSWIKYIIAVAGVPLVVSALWVRMGAAHFALAGAAFVAVAVWMMVLDRRAAARCDRQVATAAQAHAAYRLARSKTPPPKPATEKRRSGARVTSAPAPPIP